MSKPVNYVRILKELRLMQMENQIKVLPSLLKAIPTVFKYGTKP